MKATLLLIALTVTALVTACEQPAKTPAGQTLRLVKQWVQGEYNNVAQSEADLLAQLPPEITHRPMYQLFAPVDAPLLEGYIVYQQSSLDGSTSPGMIFRHGLMQYFPNEDDSLLHQRELYFKDADSYKNTQLRPEIVANITLDDITWDSGCDFHLQRNAAGTLVSGPITENGCVVFNQGLQKNMYADDVVEITETEYRFRGRFVDDTGTVVWGTESDELNTFVRQD
jgi:hypothetical protein